MNTTANPSTPSAAVQRLQAMRADLLAQVRQQRGADLSRAEAAAHVRDLTPSDWAQADAEHDLAIALEEREMQLLNDIDAALSRVAQGSYGVCVDCGADIPETRLQANPLALRCISCQSRYEHDHPQTGMPSM